MLRLAAGAAVTSAVSAAGRCMCASGPQKQPDKKNARLMPIVDILLITLL